MLNKIKDYNNKIALYGTKVFGNMWAFYIFFIWGLLGMLPFIPQSFKNLVLLISSAWIQLWALPLLAVGNSVLNKASDKRSQEQYKLIKEDFKLQSKELEKIESLQIELSEINKKLELLLNKKKVKNS